LPTQLAEKLINLAVFDFLGNIETEIHEITFFARIP
jgi:hypothetical protein